MNFGSKNNNKDLELTDIKTPKLSVLEWTEDSKEWAYSILIKCLHLC
jgi:hypothetical protein